MPSYDTFILFEENNNRKKEIIKILTNQKFGTKNLPDAMEWHCSYFWDHALQKKNEIKNSEFTKKILDNCIAIPIWLRKSEDEYLSLAKTISTV